MINYFSQVIRSQRVKKSLVLVNIIGLSLYCNSITHHTLCMVGVELRFIP